MNTFKAPSTPRGQVNTDTAIRHLACAVLALRASLDALGPSSLDAASGALVLGLLEQGTRSLAFAQIRTVFQ
ncbi:HNH endonuclease signature motif containing protein, partial [Paeniglutamicibacter antarcticus]